MSNLTKSTFSGEILFQKWIDTQQWGRTWKTSRWGRCQIFLDTLKFQIQGTSVLFEELFWNLTEMSIITILYSFFAFYWKYIYKQGMVVHTSNLSTWEVEAGRSLWVGGQSGLYSKFENSENYIQKHCLKTKQSKTKNQQQQQKKSSDFFYFI